MAQGNRALAPELAKFGVLAGFRYINDFILSSALRKVASVDTEKKTVSLFKRRFRG